MLDFMEFGTNGVDKYGGRIWYFISKEAVFRKQGSKGPWATLLAILVPVSSMGPDLEWLEKNMRNRCEKLALEHIKWTYQNKRHRLLKKFHKYCV